MWVVAAGLVAGSLHVVSGPDHLIALAPIAAINRRVAFRLGCVWGLGHGLGVAVLGGIGLGAKGWVDVGLVSAWSEFVVGIALVSIGAWSIFKASKVTIHTHAHAHIHTDAQPSDHAHFHVHVGESHDSSAHRKHNAAALGLGLFHGAAGVGHLFGVVPALALPSDLAVVYIGAYLGAAVISMGVFGAALGAFINRRGEAMMRRIMVGTGCLAMGLGCVWSFRSWPI
jgi:hypothetical protein